MITLSDLGAATIAAVVLSVLLEWVPAFKVRWDAFEPRKKQMIMAAAVFILTIGIAAIDCFGAEVCPVDGWYGFVVQTIAAFLAALGVQQGVYRIVKVE